MRAELYRYSPLEHTDSIRLIRLNPSSSFKYDLRCEIFSVYLQEKPPYEALSYTWGLPVSPETFLFLKTVTS